jgi:hypothetical protein
VSLDASEPGVRRYVDHALGMVFTCDCPDRDVTRESHEVTCPSLLPLMQEMGTVPSSGTPGEPTRLSRFDLALSGRNLISLCCGSVRALLVTHPRLSIILVVLGLISGSADPVSTDVIQVYADGTLTICIGAAILLLSSSIHEASHLWLSRMVYRDPRRSALVVQGWAMRVAHVGEGDSREFLVASAGPVGGITSAALLTAAVVDLHGVAGYIGVTSVLLHIVSALPPSRDFMNAFQAVRRGWYTRDVPRPVEVACRG